MTPHAARLIARLYPWAWRERYGDEFEALLESSSTGLRTSLNVIGAALIEHLASSSGDVPGGIMTQQMRFLPFITRQPSALLPLAMSLAALLVVLGTVAIFGVIHGADEGAAAHIWQLLMAVQIPVIAFFALKWLRRAPRQTAGVLALLAGTWLANFAAVFFFT